MGDGGSGRNYLLALGLDGLDAERQILNIESERNMVRRLEAIKNLFEFIDFRITSVQSNAAWPAAEVLRRLLPSQSSGLRWDARWALLQYEQQMLCGDLVSFCQTASKTEQSNVQYLEGLLAEQELLANQFEAKELDKRIGNFGDTNATRDANELRLRQMNVRFRLLVALTVTDEKGRARWRRQAIGVARSLLGVPETIEMPEVNQEAFLGTSWKLQIWCNGLIASSLGQSNADSEMDAIRLALEKSRIDFDRRLLIKTMAICIWHASEERQSDLIDWIKANSASEVDTDSEILAAYILECTPIDWASLPTQVAIVSASAKVLLGLGKTIEKVVDAESMNQLSALRPNVDLWRQALEAFSIFRAKRDVVALKSAYELIYRINWSDDAGEFNRQDLFALHFLAGQIRFELHDFEESIEHLRQAKGFREQPERSLHLLEVRALVALAGESSRWQQEASQSIDLYESLFPNTENAADLRLARVQVLFSSANVGGDFLSAIVKLSRMQPIHWPTQLAVLERLPLMSIDDVQTLTDGQANSKALGFQFFFDRLCEAEGVPDEAVLRGYNILHALSLSKELPLNQWRFLRDSVEYRSLKNRLPQESVVLLETMELDMLEALASNNVTVSRKIALKLLKSDAPVRSKMNAAIVLLDQVDSAQSSDSATEMLQAVSSSISLENLAAGNLAKGLPVAKQLSDRLLNHGFIDKASQTIDVLDKLAPNDLQVQFLDARLLAKQGKWDEAVVGFRSIAARTTVGSDIWLDAKMGQVESLSHVDVDIAKAVVVQVYELVDDLPIERKELLDAILNGR